MYIEQKHMLYKTYLYSFNVLYKKERYKKFER